MSTDVLKIAYIGARGVGGTYSGIETYYEEVGSRLAQRGHRVTAYCRSYFTPKVESFRGIQVRRLPALRSKHLETLSHSLLATADCLFRDFDIVQFHAVGSAPLSVLPRLVGKTTIVSVRGLDWQRAKWGRFAKWVLRAGEWSSVRAPTATVVVSETLRQFFLDVHGRDSHTIPNALVMGTEKPIQRIAEYGLEKDGFVLFAGRISPEKGVHTLLEAMRHLPRHKKLVLAGGSSYSDSYIEELRQSAWDDVLFLGQVDHATVEELYSNCYAFILPSSIEGLSIALLEALSFGTCIVTTGIPENLEVVGDSALVVEPGNVESLRGVLGRILESPELVERYRRLASEQAQRRPDWDEVTRMTEDFYYQVLDRRQHSPV